MPYETFAKRLGRHATKHDHCRHLRRSKRHANKVVRREGRRETGK